MSKCQYCQMLDIERDILDSFDSGQISFQEAEDELHEIVTELENLPGCRCGQKDDSHEEVI